MTKLNPLKNKYCYNRVIGTGGLGTGMIFRLEGDHTLGRNESRPGERLPYKDYCKQHIILHYMSVLLAGDDFSVCPIGMVGDDEQGRQIFNEMLQAGMVMEGVSVEPGASTLFSVCFIYPDSTGGNITTSNSASDRVTPAYTSRFAGHFGKASADSMVLAAPEVPMEARIRLLEEGRKRKYFNAASVLSSETEIFEHQGGFTLTDLLSVNIDEAAAIIRAKDDNTPSGAIAESCYLHLHSENPDIQLIVTDGPNGSYCFHKGKSEYIPALKTEVAATGGAGDALLSGTLAGLCCGLPFLKGSNDAWFSQTPAKSAVELGIILASLSVTSFDSIHQTADARLLRHYTETMGVALSEDFCKILSS